jgi:hypothetical protein
MVEAVSSSETSVLPIKQHGATSQQRAIFKQIVGSTLLETCSFRFGNKGALLQQIPFLQQLRPLLVGLNPLGNFVQTSCVTSILVFFQT